MQHPFPAAEYHINTGRLRLVKELLRIIIEFVIRSRIKEQWRKVMQITIQGRDIRIPDIFIPGIMPAEYRP